MNLAVTAVDREYLPALRALHNSMQEHSSDTELLVMTYGDDDLVSDVLRMGVPYVARNRGINAPLPTSVKGHWPTSSPAMYARLLIPDICSEEKAVWIDADSIVLTDLSPLFDLDMGPCPVAAVDSKRPMSRQIDGLPVDEQGLPSFYSGLMVYDCKEWREQEITERCLEVMRTRDDLDFIHVVQSVMCYVIRANFYALDSRWQAFGNRVKLPPDPWVVHYHGGNKPWLNHHPNCERNRKLWERYA